MSDPAFDFRKSRILYKMSWEITSMIGGDGSDFSKIEDLMNKIMRSREIRILESRIREFYEIVYKKGAGTKQRRGIAYKLDKVLEQNENLSRLKDPIKWEKYKSSDEK